MTKKYEKIGGGQYGVYREKKTDSGEVLGGIVVAVIAVIVIANIF